METINLYESLAPSIIGLGVSALNGIKGESLHIGGSLLEITPGFYHQNRKLKLTPEKLDQLFPVATPKIAIFVHGLSSHEQLWSFPFQGDYESKPDDFVPVNYGSLLLDDFGFTPFYLRYNSGLHISDNGQHLSALIDELLLAYPVPAEEIVLVGHSLGGLVIRSACHYGQDSKSKWVSLVKKAFYLGTPHFGTPWENSTDALYERMGKSENPILRKIANIYESRSSSIRDLRHPHLAEEDWQDEVEGTSVPWLSSMAHYFIGGTIMNNPDHPISHVMGDGLVPMASAHVGADFHETEPKSNEIEKYSALVSGVNHVRLVHEPRVYSHIKQWMEDNDDMKTKNPETGSSGTSLRVADVQEQ